MNNKQETQGEIKDVVNLDLQLIFVLNTAKNVK